MEGSIAAKPGQGQATARADTVRGSGSGWRRLIWRSLLTIVLMAGVLFGGRSLNQYLVATKPQTPRQASLERPKAVEVVTATRAQVNPTLTVYGEIAAGRSVDLRMLVAGEVTTVSDHLVEGGQIAEGEVLVTVDPFEFEGAEVRARADLAEAEARITEIKARIRQESDAQKRAEEQRDIARRETERLQTLVGRGASSDASFDSSRSRLSAAIAAVESRQNQIRILEAQLSREEATLARLRWSVGKAERDIRNTRLLAPFEGIVSNVAAEKGRLLNVSDRIATLVDFDRFEVRFTLSDAQYGRLVAKEGAIEGRPVKVRWHGGREALEADGTIHRVSPVVSSDAGGFQVYARLTRSPATEAMRPGAFVTVETPDVVYDDVVRLPQSAVHPGSAIYIVGADKRLAPVKVEVVGFDGSAPLVKGPIPAGATVMATRLPNAGPGLLVQPLE